MIMPVLLMICFMISLLYLEKRSNLSNTPKQIHVRDSLNYNKKIEYIHLPGILNEIPVKMLIDEGFLPSAIANYLVLLGNKTPKEIFTLEEAVEWFDIKNISQNSVKFDIDKLKFINKKHLEKIDEMRLSKILGFADTDIGELGKLFLKEANTIKEIKSKIDSIFNKKTTCKGFEKEFTKIKSCMKEAPFYENFNELKEYVIEKTGLKGENFFNPF